MGHLTDAQYRIIADRMIEEHRKYGDRLRPGHWADVAARKVASHMADFREGERVFTESEVAELIKCGNAMSTAMYAYQMDVDDSPPQKHRDMMMRWEQAVVRLLDPA
jgi:hypothetical protein